MQQEAQERSLKYIKVADLEVDPLNMRQEKNEAADAELLASVQQRGILQPLLVRDMGAKKMRIVAGHRRFMAAKGAALDMVPCLIQSSDDSESHQDQLVENLQRLDLAPMDEAQGFATLEADGMTIDEIAIKTGKSKSTVHGRLRLLKLSAKVRKAVSDGQLEISWAVEFRRVAQHEDQDELLKQIIEGGYNTPTTIVELIAYIEKNYALALSKAAFDIKDPDLVKSAGACVSCPTRTGAQADMFDGVSKVDACLNGACFRAKVKALGDRLVAEAKKDGRKVLTGPAALRVTGKWGNGSTGWVNIDDRVSGMYHATVTGREALKTAGLEKKAVICLDKNGMPTEWYNATALRPLAKKLDKSPSQRAKGKPKTEAEKKAAEVAAKEKAKAREKQLLENAKFKAKYTITVKALAKLLTKWNPHKDMLPALVKSHMDMLDSDDPIEFMNLDRTLKQDKLEKAIVDAASGKDRAQAIMVTAAIMVNDSYRCDEIIKAFGLDEKAIAKDAAELGKKLMQEVKANAAEKPAKESGEESEDEDGKDE